MSASVTLTAGQPGDIYPGETTRIEITLSNSNTLAPITGVAFSNNLPGVLPNGLKVAGAATYTCTDPSDNSVTDPGPGTLTAVDQAIALADGIIPARANDTDGTCTITIPVTARSSTGNSATYTYTVSSGAVTGNDGGAVSNAGSVSQSVNVRAMSVPTISKVFGTNTLTLGGSSTTLTITVTNPNATVAIPNFSITDNFPQSGGQPIIQIAGVPAETSTCTGAGTPATFTPVAGNTSLTASGGTIAAGGSCTITVAVTAKQTNNAYQTSLLNNTITGTTDFTNDLGLVPANATAQIRSRSPLRVTKGVNAGSLATGQTGSFTITLYNDGSTPLAVDNLTDDPIDGVAPAGAGHPAYGLSVTGVSTTCGGTAVATTNNTGINLTGATIPANSSCTVTANFTGTVETANTPRSYTNSISQGVIDVGDAAIVSQAASAALTVYDNLNVSKSVSPSSAGPGNPVRYQVTAQNWSTSDMNNVDITDALANSQTFLTGTISGINYTPALTGTGCVALTVTGATGDATPVFRIGTLPQRSGVNSPGSCTVTFWAKTSASAANNSNYTNILPANSVCAGATCNGGASNTTSGTVTTSVLSVAKTFSQGGTTQPPSALNRPEGMVVRMSLTLSNLSANALTGLSVSDTLPTSGGNQLKIANPANAASTCGSPTITAVPGSTSLSLNGGTVPARASSGLGSAGSCVVQVDVIGAAGVYANTASATATETYADGGTHAVNATSNSATVTYTSSLSAIKTFSPTAVASGGRSTVTVRLSNSGAPALTNMSVTDPLPAGMVLASPVNAYTTCGGSTSFTGSAGAGSITMTGADITGNGTCDMLFDVTATGGANWINTIPIGNITANGDVSNQTAVTGTLNYSALTGPSVSKTLNPSTLTFPGQISRLTITLTAGTSSLTNLNLTDYFTANGTSGAAANGMKIAPTAAAATTCPGGVVSAAAGGSSISLSGANVLANASCTVAVNVTSTAVGGITNYIPIGSVITNQGLSNTGQASGSLATQANIGITKQFTPNQVKPGERSRLRITFYNPTALPVSGLSVTDTLPGGVTVPSGPNPTTTCSGATVSAPTSGQVQVSGSNIVAASGGVAASCYTEIDVLVSAQGDYVNTIPVGAITATVGGAPASNSQSTSDTLRAKSPVVIHKAIATKTLDAGNPAGFTTGTATKAMGASATLTVSIQNPNAVALTSAHFTDTLPTGLVIAQTPNAVTTCTSGVVTASASGTNFSLAGATLSANATCTVSVDVLSNISGSYTNTIAAGALTTYEGVSNEEPTSAKVVVSTPPAVTKQFSPPVIGSGGTSTMTIFLGNSNTSAVTLNSALTDTLPTAPGNIVVAATPNVQKTCTGVVTAVAGSGSVTYANGAQVPAGGCYISVDVTGSTAGVHTNNIPAGALQTDFGNSQDPANATLTVSALGFISGKVFRDNNLTPNGTFQSGTDTAISGNSIQLRGGANCSGALVDTQMTDSAGNYLFTSLAAGAYSVCQMSQPSGTLNGITTAGAIISANGSTGTAGTASNPTITTSQILGVILNGDGGSGDVSGATGNNFAEVVPSSISGKVFLDQNNNGVVNGPDAGIAGVTVNLTGTDVNSNAVNASTTTGSDGVYSFTNLQPGSYSITEPTQPTDTANGITTAGAVDNGGTPGTATNPTTVPSLISSIVLPPNTVAADNNFAEIPKTRSISGTVFLDYNNNGVQNGSDYGISGVSVSLTGTDASGNAVAGTTTTASDGAYSFTSLPAGTYAVNEPSQPTGTTNGTATAGTAGGTATNPTATSSRIAAIVLASSTISTANDFAEVPGAAPDLTIVKTHTPSSFGEGSSNGYFTLTPQNIGSVATSGTIMVTDTLPTGMTVAAAATGTGWTCTGSVGASAVTCTTTNVIGAASTGNAITLRVTVDGALAGQLLTNSATISGGGEPPGFDGNNTDTDTVAISTTASISGTVWRDTNHNRIPDASEERLAGWTVDLLLNSVLVGTTTTVANGTYTLTGLSPGSGFQIRFLEPTTGLMYGDAVPNEQGIAPTNGARDTGATTANSGGTNSGNPAGADLSSKDGTLNNLTILAGDNIVQQSLPLDPAGVVYNAVTRNPVAGAVVTITGPGAFVPATDLVGGNASVTTAADGFYQFLLMPGAPVGTYTLAITTYPSGYKPLPSAMITACTNTMTVNPAPPDPALVQTSNTAPASGATIHSSGSCPATTGALAPANQATTQYYFTFTINPTTSTNIVNNHIPLDPQQAGDIVVTKTTPLVNVTIGQLVPYVITARNISAAPYSNLDIHDVLPPGFKFRSGSATVDGVKLDPTVSGRNVTWVNQSLAAGVTKTYKLILVVGSGVQPGEYVNTAEAISNITNTVLSNLATATVRVVPDPLFDCSDVIGKVFDDKNTNGYENRGEMGIPHVRVATVNGLLVTSDDQGRFHVACADIPNELHGSHFVMKLDERTLPTGYRLTTENPRDVLLTRGKVTKLNFGAAIHKVIRVDVNDAAFKKDSAELKEDQVKRIKAFSDRSETPSLIIRICYTAVNDENIPLARRRLRKASDDLKKIFEIGNSHRTLMFEEELVTAPDPATNKGAP